MKFVDEAIISVHAGNGGHGCLSFLREKFRPMGGPDGGDGGRGGDVVLITDEGINTLADFRFTRTFKARTGVGGAGKNRAGKRGDDCIIKMPSGTLVYDADTGELIIDMATVSTPFVIAQGGYGGAGNARFKSSTNQAPRRTTLGAPGEERRLKLELRVLADVGLLGLPNAGKSTLLRAISNARPRVAEYPFTTLHPELGVVDMGSFDGFVVADIPGLIEGAAGGAGLGIRFLKHLMRTRLLLHIVDISGMDPETEPVQAIRTIENEIDAFKNDLDSMPRWLVFNKIDCFESDEAQRIVNEIVATIDWQGPAYLLSAVTGAGCDLLIRDIASGLKEMRESEQHAKGEA
ncbi:MAG: GTPase Obg [marine bacterium B5-7]|nr:MAG: GTPase Obg [marine bacterium B5-7]